jgi:hypothetical protein
VALLYQKKIQPTSYNIPLYIYKKAVAQLKLKDQYRRKTDDAVSTKLSVYTRDQLLVTGFLG